MKDDRRGQVWRQEKRKGRTTVPNRKGRKILKNRGQESFNSVIFKFNHSKKRKGSKTKPDLEEFFKSSNDRTVLLDLCNSVYDPLDVCHEVHHGR